MADPVFDPLQYGAANRDLILTFGWNPAALTRHYQDSGKAEGRPISGFDWASYAASNPEVARAYGWDPRGVMLHYVQVGIPGGLPTASFDYIQYAAASPDLARAFGADRAVLVRHYLERGADEDRPLNGFDWVSYAAANPEVARVYGWNPAGVVRHYLDYGADARLPTRGFDPIQYAAANPDLARAFGANAVGLTRHYLDFGADEGRRLKGFDWLNYAAANPEVARTYGWNAAGVTRDYVERGAAAGLPTQGFDHYQYAAANPDLARIFAMDRAALMRHYLDFGADEGRPLNGFNWLSYAAANPDLARVYGTDQGLLLRHYLTRGAQEGRPTQGFDYVQYGAANADVVRTVGFTAQALEKHYVEFGARLALPLKGFDGVAYLLSNPDLQAARFGPVEAFRHWVNNGIAEGRQGDSLFGREQVSHAAPVNARLAGRIDKSGDQDWYSVTLGAGQQYVVTLLGAGSGGGTLADGALTVHDSTGKLIATDLDIGPGEDAVLTFVAPNSGLFYVVAKPGNASAMGTYELEVTASALVAENSAGDTVTGSLFANEADPAAWTVGGSSGTRTLTGIYGTLTLQSNGSWSYWLDNRDPDTERLLSGETAVDVFEYNATDGRTVRTASLSIAVAGAPDTLVGGPTLFAPVEILPAFPKQRFMPSVADFDGDGVSEPFGYIAGGGGTFVINAAVAAVLDAYPGRAHRDARLADLDGDGNLDVILNVYTSPTDTRSYGLILYGDGIGGIRQVVERHDINGFGETIVTADFDNDGDLDVFLPVYTHTGTSPSNYLLLNDGMGNLGLNEAVSWGVALANQPPQFRVEGAQAVDINYDGLIDLFTASHMFVNRGGRFDQLVLAPQDFDEGSKLFDYDNDGDFDLVLMNQDFGPKLYEWDGNSFVSRGYLAGESMFPGVSLNVYDIDNNGWEDVVARLPTTGMVLFLNYGGHLVRTDISSDFHIDAMTFGDLNRDGKMDVVVRGDQEFLAIYQNILPAGRSLSIEVLGAAGEQNQQGRSLTLTSLSDPTIVMARAVDSGSGYMAQTPYELLVGLPLTGAYAVKVFFAGGSLSFEAGEGQAIKAFADGRVQIEGSAAGDLFSGSAGADRLIGGGGADSVAGGAGADHFVYSHVTDSTVGAADLIRDFSVSEGDKLDFSSLDPSGGSGAVAFSVIGSAAFSGAAGEIRVVEDAAAAVTRVFVDIDGNAEPDMEVVLSGSVPLTTADFLF